MKPPGALRLIEETWGVFFPNSSFLRSTPPEFFLFNSNKTDFLFEWVPKGFCKGDTGLRVKGVGSLKA